MMKVTLLNYANNLPIGMIVPSMLTEAQFQEINGTSWVLADGRSVTGSVYASVTGSGTIPDLRGQVLRGKNNGRVDGNQDPAGERALGAFQNDQMQGHRHALQGQNRSAASGTPGNNQNIQEIGTSTVFSDTTSTGVFDPKSDGTNGTPRTGTETRVRNIAVNYFIKINP